MLRRPASCLRLLRASPVCRLSNSHFRYVSTSPPLIRIKDGSFYRDYPAENDSVKGVNHPLFQNFSFLLPSAGTADPGKENFLQHWAVIGSLHRTDLLDILRGQFICIPPTARSYPYLLTDEIAVKDPRLRFVGNAIQYIGFRGEGSGAIGGTRGAYLSARYESFREETDWTVRQYLKGQTSLNPLEGEEEGTVHDEKFLAQVISDLHLESLLDMPVANLSNGQTRRARIAKALLGKPELLLLDEPFMGLDPATTRSISGVLGRLAEKCSPHLILGLRPQDDVPDWITHLLIIGNSGHILLQGERSNVSKTLNVWRHLGQKKRPTLTKDEKEILREAKKNLKAGIIDEQLLRDLKLTPRERGTGPEVLRGDGEPLVQMDGVKVEYGEKVVLGNWQQKVNGEPQPGLHWTVRRGQRWVIIGPNGSGKTTLLSLVTSDHPQAYALPIRLFGRSRLPEPGKPGISVFELQSRLGHSSPEIHAFFPRQLTVRQALESSFAETFLSKPKLNHDRDLDISAMLRFFKADLDSLNEAPPKIALHDSKEFPDIAGKHGKHLYTPADYDVDYADILTFGSLTTSQQRLVLFLRTLVHRPDIVILDEAFSSMSASLRDKCIQFLEYGETSAGSTGSTDRDHDTPIRFAGLSDNQALLIISHVKEEIPDSVRHYIRLPSEIGGADGEYLDFRMGTLQPGAVFNSHIWDVVWSPSKEFEKHSQKNYSEGGVKEDGQIGRAHV